MINDENEAMAPDQFARPKISTKKSFSPIWILPIVALLIGLGLIVKSYLNAGIMITLQVPSAEGIEVGKTQVLYKGITTGVVKERGVTDDLQNVLLHIEMDKRTAPFLNENAKFWVVEPRISLSGVSGLDTILGGRYIAIEAEEIGETRHEFVALNVPPPPSIDAPGLHIKLRLKRLASVDRGTVIYYRQIPVGEVTNYTLEENDTEIHAWVLIKPEFAHLLKENSLFYNVSGIKVNAGLSGVKIETESLISVLVGGIAFYTPKTDSENKPAKHGSFYLLYDDFESANIGIPIIMRFKNVNELQENQTKIKFQGQTIGTLGKFSYDKETNETIVVANIDPLMEDALTENTQFWIVKPSISLLKVSGLDALIQGNYIEMRPALKGKSKREFLVSESIPPLSDRVPGLHLYIESDALGSIDKGVPLYYKNIPVGNIEGFELIEDDRKVRLKAFIKPEFSHLVKKHSRFYNVSGLKIQGGVSGIKIRTESLASLISGGIAFYTPAFSQKNQKTHSPVKNGDSYKLYEDFDDAKAGIEVTLIFDTAAGLEEGKTKVIYKGIVLGIVKKITPDKKTKTVIASVILDPIAEEHLVEDTRFWMVKPKISISGIHNIETLLSGNYITLRLGSSKKKQTSFNVTQNRPPFANNHPGLHLKLNSSELDSISVGSPIMYHRIKIGDVQDYELAKDRKSINVLVHIWPQYQDLVTSQSRFYNASGFQVDAGLSGIEVRTNSIESILKGGIALYNDAKVNAASKAKRVSNGSLFKLFKDYEAARHNAFYVRVQFDEPKGLYFGSKVKYRGIDVGEVESITLNKDKPDTVRVMLELNSSLKPVLGKKSLFWVNKAKLGLTRTEHLDTLLTGSYITVHPVKGQSAEFFIGLEEKPLVSQTQDGFTVGLTASRLSSVKTGDPVYYRQVKVGEVIGYELADTADQILIYLRIRNRFKPLIRENSKFWHASGVAVDISLFGTSKIRTESLESILSGGITFATPNNEAMGNMLTSGSFFVLHDEPKAQWTRWNPIIHLEKETLQD